MIPNIHSFFNPYQGTNFVEFFLRFFERMWGLLNGSLHMTDLASDEIQVFVLSGIAASTAIVGTFLVLRKMTMLANSLSHTILLGIVIAFVLSQQTVLGGSEGHAQPINMPLMILAALLMGFVTTFLTEVLTKVAQLQEDASMGLVFTSLFALGIILVTLLTRNAHIGAEVVMGNVDALHLDDLYFVLVILAINVGVTLLFFKEFAITTFDPALARALGISPSFFGYLLMTQVSTTSIGAFRAVGVLMVLAFITGPVLIARFLTDNLKKMLVLAVMIGCLSSIVGVALSRHLLTMYDLALSTSGVVVTTIVFFFCITLIIHYLKNRHVISISKS